jgi:hypothetical protein
MKEVVLAMFKIASGGVREAVREIRDQFLEPSITATRTALGEMAGTVPVAWRFPSLPQLARRRCGSSSSTAGFSPSEVSTAVARTFGLRQPRWLLNTNVHGFAGRLRFHRCT